METRVSPHIVDELHTRLVAELERQGETTLARERLIKIGSEIMARHEVALTGAEADEVINRVIDRMIGWGPLTPLLQDPAITEIMVNGLHSLYCERDGRLQKLPNCFTREEEIMHLINRMVAQVGRRIDASSPLVDARLADGSRINAIIPPLSLTGPVLTIRRFPPHPLGINELTARGTLSASMAAFLRAAILSKHNIIIFCGSIGNFF